MLFLSVFLLTTLVAASSASAIPATTSDVNYTRTEVDRRDVSLSKGFSLAFVLSTANPVEKETTRATASDDYDNDDDDYEEEEDDDSDNSCPSDIGSSTSSSQSTPTSTALPSALSLLSNLTGLDNDVGTACVSQNGLSKRVCSDHYEIKLGRHEFYISLRAFPQNDILYSRPGVDRKWLPVSTASRIVTRKIFPDGLEHKVVEFTGRDRDGANMYFAFIPGPTDKGEGRFLRGYKRTGPGRFESIRPLVLSSEGSSSGVSSSRILSSGDTDLSLRWGKSSVEGLKASEGIPKLWDDRTGDGLKAGIDRNGVALTKHWLYEVMDATPIYKRRALFYTGSEVDSSMMDSFNDDVLKGKGYTYFDVFDTRSSARLVPPRQKGQSKDDFTKIRYMGIYRGSRAIAQMTRASNAYVIMKFELPGGRKRSIFDEPQQYSNGKPVTIGTGQVWYSVELPALMRNPYVKRIWAVMPAGEGIWKMDKQWDASDPNAYDVRRTSLISLDDKVQVDPIKGTTR